MDLAQAWIVLGVPASIVAAGLFVGRSRTRALVGYAVLLAWAGYLLTVPSGTVSAVFVGLLVVVFVATGRGTHLDDRYAEHHTTRGRYTVARDGS